jgi:Mg2+ and Co2+ transporter CorA
VIPRVTNIHKLLGGITRVRQQLHIHDLARKRISKFAEDSKGQDQRLLYRLEDVEDELSTQMLVLDMLSERLKNMVDMEFNVASARTDIRVAAISVLAFAIAPVGFVAVRCRLPIMQEC